MYILNLSQAKLEELLPYLDTVILPIGSIGVTENGKPDTGDAVFIKSAAHKLEDQLSGRILTLPETIHTQSRAGRDTEAEDASAALDLGQADGTALMNFLLETVTPYKSMGFNKIVILYAAGTSSYVVDEVVRKSEMIGLQSIAFQLQDLEDIDRLAVPGIIGMWSRKEPNC